VRADSLSVAIVAASESGAVACPTINHLLALDQCNVTRGRPEGFAVRLAGGERKEGFVRFPCPLVVFYYLIFFKDIFFI